MTPVDKNIECFDVFKLNVFQNDIFNRAYLIKIKLFNK